MAKSKDRLSPSVVSNPHDGRLFSNESYRGEFKPPKIPVSNGTEPSVVQSPQATSSKRLATVSKVIDYFDQRPVLKEAAKTGIALAGVVALISYLDKKQP